ncbi:MAG TPA: PepSY-associated TM helix domain-containing protein [Fimbriimonadaceae bacterium]|nr:PepSY-associated TM helix domain-containing protein [Fimbriimonadaceae bacterium]HRJ96094.1 PepSY-associated TM helix domain-containing protein [Fimbriimonadaceae bacterium]
MYRLLRVVHRWVGLIASLFLLTVGITGFLLATKGTFGWIRPPEQDGQPVDSPSEIVTVDRAMTAAFGVGLAKLATPKDIDRVDFRPKRNVFKILSKEGYHEVQVCGKTGEVLQVASRNDQLAEDIHDLSFFREAMHTYLLPLVALSLVYLAASGIAMFFTPIVRRMKFNRKRADSA